MRIYIIATGGTIEKVYSEQTGNVENLNSKIDRYFRMLRLPDSEIQVTHLMNKDSLEMTDADRGRRERRISPLRSFLNLSVTYFVFCSSEGSSPYWTRISRVALRACMRRVTCNLAL